MKNISVLDCTLRDGGYVNDWGFEDETTKRLIKSLLNAKIDYIELGYVGKVKGKEENSTYFKNLNNTDKLINECNGKFLVMINYGEYPSEELIYNKNIFGIRLAFHKSDWKNALKYAEELTKKGFNVFVQPMVTMSYSDKELLEMIMECNRIKPYAMYVVDSFGAMNSNDVLRLALLIDNNLDEKIRIGFHCHNNLQLAYSNSLKMINTIENREVIIDSSVFGMGRGAGNLNTELFLDYLIKFYNKDYDILPLLDIIDNNLSLIYRDHYWGYSVAHYISAIYNCHSNYASYLMEKKKLTVKHIENIIREIPLDKRLEFDKEYIDSLYKNFNSNNVYVSDNNKNQERFGSYIIEKDILLIAPGKSIIDNKEKLIALSKKENIVSIAVNHISELVDTEFYFFNNEKRYLEYYEKIKKLDLFNKVIVTSNIKADYSTSINYKTNLGITDESGDNSTIMLLNYLSSIDNKTVYIAGMDGYRYNEQDYMSTQLQLDYSKNKVESLNVSIMNELHSIRMKLNIEFITESMFNLFKSN